MNTWGGEKCYLKIKDNVGTRTNGYKVAMHTFRLGIVRFLMLNTLMLYEGQSLGLVRPKVKLVLRGS